MPEKAAIQELMRPWISCRTGKSIFPSHGFENRTRIIAARLMQIVPTRTSSQAILPDNRRFNPRTCSSGEQKISEKSTMCTSEWLLSAYFGTTETIEKIPPLPATVQGNP
ncbi:MAG: hypothetical protein AUF79_17455 [Crenarchaeota archaeon 13_1_20CM_2_51_8]|nr:MAG: hypothetical protein AUF79_17455 [Crenarchaeota archaeon 13_1_20CM_2_51_8]